MANHQLKIDIPSDASKTIDVIRSKYRWTLPTLFCIGLKLLKLHIWAFENDEVIRIGNDEITIEELHGKR